MSYALGKYLRWRYDGYLDHVYSIQEVYVQSSDFDRTIMTALTCLAGLFPTHIGQEESDWNSDVNWQPIPVHSIPNSMDHVKTHTHYILLRLAIVISKVITNYFSICDSRN